jgi:hypothetical protein
VKTGLTRRALVLIAALAILPALQVFSRTPAPAAQASRLPKQLSGDEFWKLSTELSEPDGYFRSDNLVSNELFMQLVIPDLIRTARTGRVYVGVGPEQNFTYMAALKPSMAFIVDVRRGNLYLHLMYKALFQLSADRAEFVSRLFSLKRPAGLGRKSTAQELFTAFADPQLRSDELYKSNVAAMRDALLQSLKIPLSPEDLKGMESIYQEFYIRGTGVHYEVTPGSAGSFPSYADLMTATDGASVPQSYLATEERFALIKELHGRNMILPVVGNFAGPKAIRALAKYLRSHNALVSAFYVSNVEQYLARDGRLEAFCASAATLPTDDASTIIRSERGGFGPRLGRGPGNFGRGGFGGAFSSQLYNMRSEMKGCGR